MKDLVQLFKALSDEARVRIINLIIETGSLCVCDLQHILGFTQTKVSRHLAYLKHSGILQDHKVGNWVRYELKDADDPVKKILFKELRDLFQNQKTLQEDSQKLHKIIAKGKCVALCQIHASKQKELTTV